MSTKSIGSILTGIAKARPDALAIEYGEDARSWLELERGANRWARHLAESGVVQNDFVALTMPNGVEFHQACFAIWKLGATPCMFSSRLSAIEIDQIVKLAAPRVVVGSLPVSLAGTPEVDLTVSNPNLSSDPLPDVDPRYWKAMTSGGSTGRPKIIIDHHATRFDPSENPSADYLLIPRGGVMLNPGPLYHNAPFVMTHLSLFAGTTVIGMQRFDAEECLRLIQKHTVEFVCFVPTMMHRIWALPASVRNRYDLSSLKVVWHIAAPCPSWLKHFWIDWLGAEKIWELYGGTEAGSTTMRGDEWLKKPGSVGRVEAGSTIVLRADGELAPPREVGEIFLSTDARDRFHYIGSEPKISADGRISLGDLGFLDEDGYLFLSDRRTDMIIRGGANIYPAEIETAIDEFPQVVSTVVVGLPCDEFGQRTHAIIETEPGARLILTDLVDFLRNKLAAYKLPESFEFSSGSLRDDAGKVRRSALKAERETWLRDGKDFRLTP